MNAALELVQTVEAAGGRFEVDGDRLGIVPKDAAAPVREELRQHKLAIIELLSQRLRVPEGAWLVRYTPLRPPIKLSESETVVDTEKFIVATMRELDALLRGKKTWLSSNWPLPVLLRRLRACGCVVVIGERWMVQ